MAKRPNRDTGNFNHPAMTYDKPKELKRFQAGMTLIVSTLLVAGLWTGGWFVAQALVNSAMTDWMDQQRARGATVSYEAMELSGYPSRITLNVTAPQFSGSVFGETVEWQADTLTVMTRPWNPWALRIEAPGQHQLNLAAKSLKLKGDVQSFAVDVTPGDGWPDNLDIALSGLNLTGADPSSSLTMEDFGLHLGPDQSGNGLFLGVKGTALQLPKVANLPLGNLIESLNAEVQIDEPLSPDELSGNIGESLASWQRRENKINVQRLNFQNGPLGVSTGGVMSLDEALQPTAAFTAKIEGLFQVLEILRLEGLVTPTNAVIATMALSALSKRPANGGPASINLSVTVADGKLNLGPIPILDMPHFSWGIAAPKPIVEDVPVPRDYKDVPPVF